MVNSYNNFLYENEINVRFYTEEQLTKYARDKLNNKFVAYLTVLPDKSKSYVVVYYRKIGVGYPGKYMCEATTANQLKEKINLIAKTIAQSNWYN